MMSRSRRQCPDICPPPPPICRTEKSDDQLWTSLLRWILPRLAKIHRGGLVLCLAGVVSFSTAGDRTGGALGACILEALCRTRGTGGSACELREAPGSHSSRKAIFECPRRHCARFGKQYRPGGVALRSSLLGVAGTARAG